MNSNYYIPSLTNLPNCLRSEQSTATTNVIYPYFDFSKAVLQNVGMASQNLLFVSVSVCQTQIIYLLICLLYVCPSVALLQCRYMRRHKLKYRYVYEGQRSGTT